MSYKTELQITILIEVPVYSIHVFHYSCQRTSKLSVSNPLWQSVFPRSKSQGLESTHSVNYRTTESRISTFGRNKAFHKYIEALHTLDSQIYRDWSRETVLFTNLKYLYIHRMHYVRIIIIQSEFGSVRIPSIAKIPFVHFIHGYCQCVLIGLFIY